MQRLDHVQMTLVRSVFQGCALVRAVLMVDLGSLRYEKAHHFFMASGRGLVQRCLVMLCVPGRERENGRE